MKLMYITNSPTIALVAEKTGVDRIFIDLETLGKQERQRHVDSVKSNHSVHDITSIHNMLTTAELIVRVNPVNDDSEAEINAVIANGADMVMLPMWKSLDEVSRFVKYVDNRAKTVLLLETSEAVEILDDVLNLDGVNEIHIGLNDLHLSCGKTFMFELLSDGTVERLCGKIGAAGIPYGFGGIGRIGYGMLLAEHILCEHYRLGSGMVILSRSFCNADAHPDIESLERDFRVGVKTIRAYEEAYTKFDGEMFEENRRAVCGEVERIVEQLKSKGGVR